VIKGGKVIDGYVDPLTYARLVGKTVISLSVVKKSGENLIDANDKINKVIKDSLNS
jgi:multidrug efflux pump subunit AcrB